MCHTTFQHKWIKSYKHGCDGCNTLQDIQVHTIGRHIYSTKEVQKGTT